MSDITNRNTYGNKIVWKGKQFTDVWDYFGMVKPHIEKNASNNYIRQLEVHQHLGEKVHNCVEILKESKAPGDSISPRPCSAFPSSVKDLRKESYFCGLRYANANQTCSTEGEETKEDPLLPTSSDVMSNVLLVPGLYQFKELGLDGIYIPSCIVEQYKYESRADKYKEKLCMIEIGKRTTHHLPEGKGSTVSLEFTHVVYFSSGGGFYKQLEEGDVCGQLGEEWEEVHTLYTIWGLSFSAVKSHFPIKWKVLRWCYVAAPYYHITQHQRIDPSGVENVENKERTMVSVSEPKRKSGIDSPWFRYAQYASGVTTTSIGTKRRPTSGSLRRNPLHHPSYGGSSLLDLFQVSDDKGKRKTSDRIESHCPSDSKGGVRSLRASKKSKTIHTTTPLEGRGNSRPGAKLKSSPRDSTLIYKKVERRNCEIDSKHHLAITSGWDECVDTLLYSNIQYTLSEELVLQHSLGTPIFAMDKDDTKAKCFLLATYPQMYKLLTSTAEDSPGGWNKGRSGPPVMIKAPPSFIESSGRCIHSIIKETDCCKGFWDFERKLNPPECDVAQLHKLGDQMTFAMLDLIIEVFESVLSVTLEYSDFTIWDASKPTKISRHVVLSAPGVFFYNLGHFQRLVRIVECALIKKITLSSSDADNTKYSVLFWEIPTKLPMVHTNRQNDQHTLLYKPPHLGGPSRQIKQHPITTLVGNPDRSILEQKWFDCFWDIGASLGKTKFFRAPFAANFGELYRTLVPAEMNTFRTDRSLFEAFLSPQSVKRMDENEMLFYYGEPTAVMKLPIDTRSFSEVGIKISAALEQMHLKDALRNTPSHFSFTDMNGCEHIASLELMGYTRLLDARMQMIRPSTKTTSTENSKGYHQRGNAHSFSSRTVKCNDHRVNELLRNLFCEVPELEPWNSVVTFTISVQTKSTFDSLSRVLGSSSERGLRRPSTNSTPDPYMLKVRVPASYWCPCLQGYHRRRQGNATVRLYKNTGTLVFECWSSKCATRVLKKRFGVSSLLKELFEAILENEATLCNTAA